MWRQIAIVLVILSQSGIVVGYLHMANLFRIDGYLRWLSKLLKINCGDLVHLLEFVDVFLKLRSSV